MPQYICSGVPSMKNRIFSAEKFINFNEITHYRTFCLNMIGTIFRPSDIHTKRYSD